MTKFLIIRFSSIGDIVLTTPVIRCLKQQYPDAEVHYITKPDYKILLENNPYIDRLHVLKEPLSETIRDLKQENYDFIIDLHHNLRSLLVKRKLGVKAFSFNKLNIQKWLLVNFKLKLLSGKHIVDRYLETVHVLGIQNDGEGLDYFIPENDEVDLQTLPDSFSNGYIAFVIGAKFDTKKLPTNKVIHICEKAPYPVVLLGGHEDKALGDKIAASAGSDKIFNACGGFNLNQSASLLQQARKVITNDTGLMHIAAALGKEIISLWGNTVPEFGMQPYYGKQSVPSTLLEIKDLKCRPCSKIGFDKCPKGHFNCMNKIPDEAVIEAVKG